MLISLPAQTTLSDERSLLRQRRSLSKLVVWNRFSKSHRLGVPEQDPCEDVLFMKEEPENWTIGFMVQTKTSAGE
jgi:hypothetical protein